MTFKQAAEVYIEEHAGKWRSTIHGRQWTASLANYVNPLIGALDIAAIDVPAVLRVLEQRVEAVAGRSAGKLWAARPVTADRIRNRVELILNWAAGREYRHGDNPAAWAKLKHVLPEAKSTRVIPHSAVPYVELPRLIAELQRHEDVAAKALQFLILTAARAGEALGATHDEVDFIDRVWTIPARRMKGGKEHRVPLSDAAIAVLRSLPTEDDNPHLFIGARRQALSRHVLARALRRFGRNETVHGMRSAFSTWARERTRHDADAVELSLAHAVGGAVERAYRRGDLWEKRRKLMDDWGAYCTGPASGVAGDNIVPIGSGR